VREWGPARALEYASELDRAIDFLAERPEIGTTVAGTTGADRRWPSGSHHIYYRFTRSTLRVVAILHNRMDAPRHLR
jgi:toxin ParE1/3/4